MSRPIGSKNVANEAIRNNISEMISKGFETFEKDLSQLTPYQRIRIVLELLPYTTARYAPMPSDFVELLTDDQLNTILDKIKNYE